MNTLIFCERKESETADSRQHELSDCFDLSDLISAVNQREMNCVRERESMCVHNMLVTENNIQFHLDRAGGAITSP